MLSICLSKILGIWVSDIVQSITILGNQHKPPCSSNYNKYHNNSSILENVSSRYSNQDHKVMHLIQRSYLLPAIFLNPVLFLHNVNTILSRILPPIVVPVARQPPPFSEFGPSANHPHLDIHSSELFCWSYTVIMVFVQLVVYGRISQLREEYRKRRRVKEHAAVSAKPSINGDSGVDRVGNDLLNGYGKHMDNGQEVRKLSTVLEETYFD